jgi:hypothetical protein
MQEATMTTETAGDPDSGLDPEDAKLVTLARATRARTGARQGAAVRDADGRTYAAASVTLPSLDLSALQVAVAMAVSSGAPGLEAAVVLADHPGDTAGVAAVHDVAPEVSVFFVDGSGKPTT